MRDVVLLATMFAVCGGIGLPIAYVLPERLVWRGLVAPTLGYGVLAVLVPVAYRWGLSIRVAFFACVAIALAMFGVYGKRVVRDVRGHVWLVGVAGVAMVLLMAPRWIGGDQFSVFQGNVWDTYGYLESAIVYARKPYSYVAGAGDAEFARYPLVAMAQASLVNRPSVHQLYAVFSRVSPDQAYRLYYPFLVFSMTQLVLVGIFVLRTLFEKPRAIVAVASVLALGFWGQYVFDINAWSQVASAPALLLLFGLAVAIATSEHTWRVGVVFAIANAGALYLYPEGWLIYMAALGPLTGVPVLVRLVKTRRIASLVPMIGFLGFASAALYPPTWDFLVIQVKHTSSTVLPWWEYFQGFFLGRDHSGSMIDFAAGFVGLYFATPGAGSSFAIPIRIAIVVLVIGLIAAVIVMLAKRDAQLVAWAVGATLLLGPAAWLFHKGNYWPAGKCLSYAAPIYTLLLCMPAIDGHRLLRWFAIVFVAFHLVSGFVRVNAAKHHYGIHYKAPYPANQDDLKKQLPWDLSPLEDALGPKTRVLVQPMSVWMEAELQVFLYGRRIPFALASPANTYFNAGRDLGARPPPWVPDVEIAVEGTEIVAKFRDGRVVRLAHR